MFCNYHTHTFRCHHASGGEREYIENAIKGGIKKLGFSEHIPLVFPNGVESHFRMYACDAEDYRDTLKALKKEYAAEIEILIGFECEYYPDYFDTMFENAKRWGAEYLILGQHFIKSEYPTGTYCGLMNTREEDLVSYVNAAAAGMKRGVFSYLAHPDLFFFSGDEKVYEREMRRLCTVSVNTGIPLEINLLGIRGRRNYPNKSFWRIAGEEGAKAVLGFDAHTANDAFDSSSVPIAEELAEECGAELIDDPKIIRIQ